MRLAAQAAFLGVLLAALLTWLMVNGSGGLDAAYVRTERTLDAIALSESRLQHDVLRARTGLLRNYDSLVALVGEMRESVAELEIASGSGDPGAEAVAAVVEREAAVVERFKTDNALVQNSVAFFDSLSDRLSEPDTDLRLSQAVAALQIRMSEFARDASARRLDDVRGRIDALAAETLPPGREADVAAIVQHGRQLLDLLPRADAVTRSLLATTSEAERQRLLTALQARRRERQASADRYRVALYVVALALLVLLVRVGSLVRLRTSVLRSAIAFQTVVARIANRFLASQPEETSERIVEVLAMVGEGLGTDHCYVLMLDGTGTVHLWNRPGLAAPSGWPAAQRALVPDIASVTPAGSLVFVETREGTGPPALLRALAARGVVSWACARLRRGERVIGLLCFERSTTDLPAWLRESRGLLQVVADSFGAVLERERTWVERREIEAALRRSQRLEAIGTFTSGVAHNINNVLNVMLGHAEIAADALPPDGRAAQQIELLVQAGGRAREIARQILDFGRRGGSAQRLSAVDAVVSETVAQIQTSASEPVAVRATGSAAGAEVGGEPAQLQQVVLNLIHNAAQASAPGDAVAVHLDRVALAQPRRLSHGALRAGEHVRLRVEDAGHGMDESTLARIFEPFFTTRPAGTGLGLATAFEFVQEHDGAFDVSSRPGAGSAFEVWLPVIARGGAGAAAGGTVMVVGRSRALVQEDEEMLAALGFEPVGYAEPEAALAALHAEPGRFDLLIVEGRLAGMSGLAFARRATRISDRPVVLSLSASDAVQLEDLSSIPVVDVARRPWRSNALAVMLQRNLAATSDAAASVEA